MRFDAAPLVALQLQSLRISVMAARLRPVWIESPEQWELLRPRITRMRQQGLELAEIMREVEAEGFKASEAMFKKRFVKWGLVKYLKRKEVEVILHVKRDLEARGETPAFQLRGHDVDMADVERHRKRSKIQIPDRPFTARDLQRAPGLTWTMQVASPSSDGSSIRESTPSSSLTPSSSQLSSSPPFSIPSASFPRPIHSLPKAIAPPTSLGHDEGYLQDTVIAFQASITTGKWNLSRSTEMPWFPGATAGNSDPVVPQYYWQDECFRHLSNGVLLAQQGDANTASREWREAFFLVRDVVKAAHYNTLLKLLACINFLQQSQCHVLARQFRACVAWRARQELHRDNPNLRVYCRLFYLAPDSIEALQLKTLQLLVGGLESTIGEEAFTSFEHKMVLQEKLLEKDPALPIDAALPTLEACNRAFGPASSKTLLALNMRNGILQHRGALEDAKQTCLTIVHNASMVPDPAMRLWHLGSAFMSLGRLQSTLGEFRDMRVSLASATTAETELRNKYGRTKLGDGELNWIFETLGMDPMFRDTGMEDLGVGMEAMSFAEEPILA